jgi:hypothetical protein
MVQALTSNAARHICSKSLYTNNLVVDAGFEPAKAMPADLQSALVVHLSNLPTYTIPDNRNFPKILHHHP